MKRKGHPITSDHGNGNDKKNLYEFQNGIVEVLSEKYKHSKGLKVINGRDLKIENFEAV